MNGLTTSLSSINWFIVAFSVIIPLLLVITIRSRRTGSLELISNPFKKHYKFHMRLGLVDRLKVLFGVPLSVYGAGEVAARFYAAPGGEVMLVRLEVFINDANEVTGRKE